MGNIVDYINEYGDKGFDEVPFNEVDGLVLSQFVYLKWENVIPKLTDDKDGITLTDMQEKMQEESGRDGNLAFPALYVVWKW